jgi:hypothetical protein
MHCYSINKMKWIRIASSYPEFHIHMKEKILHHYKSQIYSPLMKLKNKDIFKYQKRKDYQQIMAMNDPQLKEINKCMSDIHKDET